MTYLALTVLRSCGHLPQSGTGAMPPRPTGRSQPERRAGVPSKDSARRGSGVALQPASLTASWKDDDTAAPALEFGFKSKAVEGAWRHTRRVSFTGGPLSVEDQSEKSGGLLRQRPQQCADGHPDRSRERSEQSRQWPRKTGRFRRMEKRVCIGMFIGKSVGRTDTNRSSKPGSHARRNLRARCAAHFFL